MVKLYDEARSRKYRQISQHIGMRIKEARELKGMKGQELCDALERSTSWLSFVEKGINGVNIMDLLLVSEILEQPLEFFLSDRDLVRTNHAPESASDWRSLFPGQPERAAVHHAIDRVFRRADGVVNGTHRARGDAKRESANGAVQDRFMIDPAKHPLAAMDPFAGSPEGLGGSDSVEA